VLDAHTCPWYAPESYDSKREPHSSHLRSDKGKDGVDYGLERPRAPLYLSEEKSPLQRGEESDGEIIWVDVRGSTCFQDLVCRKWS